MRLRISDPRHVGLHRAIRAAIGTTLALLIALTLMPGTPAGVLAAFGSIAILGNADFGGSSRRRTISILSTGAAGAVLIVIGGLAALSLWSVVIVTFVVTGFLAFLVALRGTFASACPALTTIYVASAMVATSASAIPSLLAGWGIAVAIALPITLLILPRRNLAPVRSACVHALRTLAEAARRRERGEPLDDAAIRATLERLGESYLGNPFRAAGLSPSDRALIVLIGQLEGLLTAMLRGTSYSEPVSTLPETAALIHSSADTLDQLAASLDRTSQEAPTSARVAQLWGQQWHTAVLSLGDGSTGEPAARVARVWSAFPDRAMAISVVRLTILVRRVLRLAPEDLHEAGHTIPEPPTAHPLRELADQATFRSPWLRAALRTGVALALATLVVEIMGIAHGFWVVLGVVATLRLDGIATLKTSLLAVVGTFAGATLGWVILDLEGSRPLLLWIAFVLITFLAVYTQATTAYAIGQAAFSLFVIVAFSLVNWPPQLETASQRFTDILIGAGISVVVALLMWPRGVTAGLIGNVSSAIHQGTRLLSDAVADLVRGADRVTPESLHEMSSAFLRSKEVVEVSLSSRAPGAIERARAWEDVIDHLRTLTVSAHLIADWSHDGPPIAQVIPSFASPLEADCASAVAAWDRTASEVDGHPAGNVPQEPDFIDEVEALVADVDLSDQGVADRVVSAIWTHGWLHMSYRAGVLAPVPAVRA